MELFWDPSNTQSAFSKNTQFQGSRDGRENNLMDSMHNHWGSEHGAAITQVCVEEREKCLQELGFSSRFSLSGQVKNLHCIDSGKKNYFNSSISALDENSVSNILTWKGKTAGMKSESRKSGGDAAQTSGSPG